eukprot:362478-Chlamydomonas_euryale.AAC.3
MPLLPSSLFLPPSMHASGSSSSPLPSSHPVIQRGSWTSACQLALCTRSAPRRTKRGCGSDLRTKMTGPGLLDGVLLPSPSNTKRVPLGSPGLTSIVSVRASSVYSPPSASSTLRLCVTRLRQPWKISSSVSSTVYTWAGRGRAREGGDAVGEGGVCMWRCVWGARGVRGADRDD